MNLTDDTGDQAIPIRGIRVIRGLTPGSGAGVGVSRGFHRKVTTGKIDDRKMPVDRFPIFLSSNVPVVSPELRFRCRLASGGVGAVY